MANDLSATGATLRDITALIRNLAKREPYMSASGPEALRTLAAHLDDMLLANAGGRRNVIQVKVRKKKGEAG